MKNEIEKQIFEKMKAKDFGESMCNETKLNVLKWTMQQLHTIWGFETGDYGICCDNCTDSKGQNIGNMYRCDKCGRLVS